MSDNDTKRYELRFVKGDTIRLRADDLREGRDGVTLYRDGVQIAKYRTADIAGWRIVPEPASVSRPVRRTGAP